MRCRHDLRRRALTLLAGLAFESATGQCLAVPTPGNDSVLVQSIRITGSKAVPAEELTRQIADARGKRLTRAQLEQLADRLTGFYRAHGRTRVRALLPPQDFANGQVVFRIVRTNASTVPQRHSATTSAADPVLQAAAVTAAPLMHDPQTALLERARFWMDRDHPERARNQLRQLFRISPRNLQGLILLGTLQAQAGDRAGTLATLARLHAVRPDDPAITRIHDILRLATTDRARWQRARLLARGGHPQAAVDAARALCPNGPPDSDLALEYWQWVARTPDGWQAADQGLTQLLRDHPDSLRIRLAWAELRTAHAPVDPLAVQQLAALSRDPDYGRAAQQAWRSAVLRQAPSTAGSAQSRQVIAQLRQYQAFDPQDEGVRTALNQTLSAMNAQRQQQLDPATLAIAAGQQRLEANDLPGAEREFAHALALRPDDMQAIGGLGMVRLRQARYAEAADCFRRAARSDASQRRKWNSLLATARFWGHMQASGRARDAGQAALAAREARAALAMQPGQPDALVALAAALAASGDIDGAAQSYQQALAANPQQHNAQTGLAALYRDEADRLGPEHQREAVALLEHASRLDPDNPWICLDLARRHAQQGEAARGRALFDALLKRQPTAADAHYTQALFLAGQGDTAAALSCMEQIEPAQRTAKLDDYQRALQVALRNERQHHEDESAARHNAAVIRSAEAQTGAGNTDVAQRTLARQLAQRPDDPALQLAMARTFAAERNFTAAIALCRDLVARDPDASDARIEWLTLLAAQHQRQQMIRLAAQWISQGQPAPAWARLNLANWLIDQHAWTVARQYVDAVLAGEPDNARALDAASRIAYARGQTGLAIGTLQHALALQQPAIDDSRTLSALRPASTGDGSFSVTPAADPAATDSAGGDYQYRRLASMLDQDIPWISSALDWETRAGTPGQSQFEAWQLPFEWKAPWSGGGQWFARSDLVRLQAGTLDCSGSYATRTFGTLLLSNASCAGQASQQAQGASLTAGYVNDHLRADFGTTPLGFPVWNLVGGLRWKGDAGPFSWSLDASRRQDTSTLLSFAGTTDPRTGLVWGGVLATGVRAGLSLDNGGTLGFWSSFGVHELTGTNVQSNQRVRAMAGETWRIVNEEDRLFSLGLTAMDWHDTQDSGEFTFGQGGYYSPQTYRSLALPVTWAQRYARWSWAIRASVFTSWSQTDASPYFPTDPQLQASAGNPWYSTSSGPGSGYSFSAASEYQATSRLFVGSRLEIERSPYYAPNTFLLYLRYAVGAAAAQPVALPPNPVLPTSSF